MSNLCKRPVVQKAAKQAKSNRPTTDDLTRWDKIRKLGCSICKAPPQIHHIETGMGRKKNHDRVIPLCELHHTGAYGFHKLGSKRWELIYGTELEHERKTQELLGERKPRRNY